MVLGEANRLGGLGAVVLLAAVIGFGTYGNYHWGWGDDDLWKLAGVTVTSFAAIGTIAAFFAAFYQARTASRAAEQAERRAQESLREAQATQRREWERAHRHQVLGPVREYLEVTAERLEHLMVFLELVQPQVPARAGHRHFAKTH